MQQSEPSPTDDSLHTASRFQWRRLMRFQLRSLLVLMILVAGGLAWWSHRARQQRDAVAAFEPLFMPNEMHNRVGPSGFYHHAGATYEFHDPDADPIYSGPTRPAGWPAWLVDGLGVDYFSNVIGLDLIDRKTTDADLSHLENLPALYSLALSRTPISDADLVHLKNLTVLRFLDLDDTKVTDAGLAHLKHLTTLEILSLSNTKVTDAGLTHLKDMSVLETIDLNDTQVTDAGLEHLKHLKRLTEVLARGTRVTNEGAARLSQALPSCVVLLRDPE